MRQDRIINVFFHDRLVGTLAMTNERKAAFEYADEWLENGLSPTYEINKNINKGQ